MCPPSHSVSGGDHNPPFVHEPRTNTASVAHASPSLFPTKQATSRYSAPHYISRQCGNAENAGAVSIMTTSEGSQPFFQLIHLGWVIFLRCSNAYRGKATRLHEPIPSLRHPHGNVRGNSLCAQIRLRAHFFASAGREHNTGTPDALATYNTSRTRCYKYLLAASETREAEPLSHHRHRHLWHRP